MAALAAARAPASLGPARDGVPLWEGATRGHLSPDAEKAHLKSEIANRMEKVEKLLANGAMAADKKIAGVEALKEEINERKTRLVQLKVEARAAAAAFQAGGRRARAGREAGARAGPAQGRPRRARGAAPQAAGGECEGQKEPPQCGEPRICARCVSRTTGGVSAARRAAPYHAARRLARTPRAQPPQRSRRR